MLKLALPLSLATVFLTITAMAALPPLSQEDREEMASDIISGTVMGVRSSIEARRAGFLDEIFTVVVQVAEVHRGALRPGQMIKLTYWRAFRRPSGWCGPGGQYGSMAVGDNIRAYMTQNSEDMFRLLEPNGFDHE